MADIARNAGLGRVTIYSHFGSRAELVDAVTARIVTDGDRALDGVDLEGDPRQALERLIRSSWQLVDRSRSILAAAQDELSTARIRELHDGPAARVEDLIRRGRAVGAFRTDLPETWLVAMLQQILHGAASEIAAGRLARDDVPDLIVATTMCVFIGPASAGHVPCSA